MKDIVPDIVNQWSGRKADKEAVIIREGSVLVQRSTDALRMQIWAPEKVMLELSPKDEGNYPGKGHSD